MTGPQLQEALHTLGMTQADFGNHKYVNKSRRQVIRWTQQEEVDPTLIPVLIELFRERLPEFLRHPVSE